MFFRGPRGNTRPLLPSREIVAFPNQPVALVVGRPRSIAAVQAAARMVPPEIVLVAQRESDVANPTLAELYDVGTCAVIDQVLQLPDGNLKVVVEGRDRVRILRHVSTDPYFDVEYEVLAPVVQDLAEAAVLARTVRTTFERFARLQRAIPPDTLAALNAIEDPGKLADAIIAPLGFKLAERQELLETVDPQERLERVYRALLTEIEFLNVEKKLKGRVRRERESTPREPWSDAQQRTEPPADVHRSELDELAARIAALPLPEAIRLRASSEMRKLGQMNAVSAEATVVRNWLDHLLALPWGDPPPTDPIDLDVAQRILDEDHHGLERVKDRILEHLAVGRLVQRVRGPVVCLVGPPGVGKTSLARSIARAMGRPFVRVALGGVRDEAEIRGHRRTYVGAMPGKILHALRRADRTDPVVLLDEIDKMSSDLRGDPAAALLEVLDPEQNHAFADHYLDVDYDLSRILFICTANDLQGIPVPLQDRLEVLELGAYTDMEKLAIARRYLLPRQLEMTGLNHEQLSVSNQALLRLVTHHTREAGVRDLDRQIATLCRKTARRVVTQGQGPTVHIVSTNVDRVLGPPRYGDRPTEAPSVGVVMGLAVTPWGGDVLPIEAVVVPGKGEVHLTGRLGDWLKESAWTALTFIRSRAAALSLSESFHERFDIHVHYPGNPLRTDGPSAGLAMAVAMASALTGLPVRADIAMTGEIGLRGQILPIGGLREKLLAAHRRGLSVVFIPDANAADLERVPKRVLSAMDIRRVSSLDAMLEGCFAQPLPASWRRSAAQEVPCASEP